MKKKFINGLLLVALFVGFTGSMVSCKDYDDEKVGNLESILADKNSNLSQALEAQKKALQDQIDALNTALTNCQTTCSNFRTTIEAKLDEYYTKKETYSKAEVDALLDEIKALITKEAIANTVAQLIENGNNALYSALEAYVNAKIDAIDFVHLNDNIANVKAIADEALALAKQNQTDIAGLQTVVDGLSKSIVSLGSQVDEVRDAAAKAQAKADANAILIENLQKGFEALQGQVDDLQEQIDALKAQAAADAEAADELHRQMLETIGGLAEAAETIGQLQDQLNANYNEIMDDIDFIYEILLNTQLNILDTVDAIENAFAKFITNIEINGTTNPLFGEFALPFDVRSNILVAFHGTIDSYGLQFPTARPAYYALPDDNQWETITDEDIEMIGDLSKVPGYLKIAGNTNIVALDGAEGNAGTLYLTVNPTERDFTGTEFELINSQNETNAIVLSDLAKSNHTLKFGYTRAGVTEEQSPNGFYEAKATLTAEDVENADRLNIDLAGIKDVAKDLKNLSDGINVTSLVSTIYNNISQVLDAQAVKATWEDDFGTRSVVSQYSIAATTIKPLSFAFAKDIEFTKVPGLSRIEKFIDNLIDKVDIDFPEVKVKELDIKNIELVELSDELLAKFKVTLSKTLDTGENLEFVVDLTEAVSELYDDITGPIGDVQGMIDQLKDFVASINDYLGELNKISLDGLTGNLQQTLSSYINKINKTFARYFGHPNKYLQPLMLVKGNGSFARLSESKNYPARVSGTQINLAPTTYNAELLSPAYKKFIAVTNVSKGDASAKGGDAACKNVLKKANEQSNICEVIDGGFAFIPFKAESGYTYELLYSAVDYTGKVATKKFYVKVK